MKVKIQHEFDHEPTYIVADDEKETELVCLSPALIPSDRFRLSAVIKAALEAYLDGSTLRRRIKERLVELASEDKLPLDMNNLDMSLFDDVLGRE